MNSPPENRSRLKPTGDWIGMLVGWGWGMVSVRDWDRIRGWIPHLRNEVGNGAVKKAVNEITA